MPYAAPRTCGGCGALVLPRQRCPSCVRARDQARGSARRRGYDAQWERLRQEMPKTPCADCGAPWQPGFHLDHVQRKRDGGPSEARNLEWRCPRHHSAVTVAFDGGFGRPRRDRMPLAEGLSQGSGPRGTVREGRPEFGRRQNGPAGE